LGKKGARGGKEGVLTIGVLLENERLREIFKNSNNKRNLTDI